MDGYGVINYFPLKMLIDAIFILGIALEQIFYGIFQPLQSIIPQGFQDSANYIAGVLSSANGYFPVDTLLLCISFMSLYFIISYGIRVFLMIWHFFVQLLHGHGGGVPAHESSSNNLKRVTLRSARRAGWSNRDESGRLK